MVEHANFSFVLRKRCWNIIISGGGDVPRWFFDCGGRVPTSPRFRCPWPFVTSLPIFPSYIKRQFGHIFFWPNCLLEDGNAPILPSLISAIFVLPSNLKNYTKSQDILTVSVIASFFFLEVTSFCVYFVTVALYMSMYTYLSAHRLWARILILNPWSWGLGFFVLWWLFFAVVYGRNGEHLFTEVRFHGRLSIRTDKS